MARLLIVDDEPLVLDVQQQLLRRKCPEWETVCAPGGSEALNELENSQFDVVIADMRMPGIDGATLLAKVRDEYPSTVRIIQSGHSDRDAAMRAVTSAHLFLAKPTQIADLQELLQRVATLQDLLKDPKLQEVAGGVHVLPSVPRVYLELTECLASEDSSIQQISDILQTDTAMCAKVLQIARSAFFGLPRDTTNVTDAVSWLGVNLVKSLALTSGVFESFRNSSVIPGFSIEAEQKHALQVSHASGMIVGRDGNADHAIMAGMVHDVGRLILASRLPEVLQELIDRAKMENRELHQLEKEHFGVTHAELGAYLLGLWGLPHPVVEAVAHHHEPSRVPTGRLDTVAAVHVANALARAGSSNLDESPVAGGSFLDAAFVERLGIESRIEEWRQKLSGLDEAGEGLT